MTHPTSMNAFLIGLLLCASTATAQPIHGHPQKAAYASVAEYPKPSGQCHWLTDPVLPEAKPDGSNSQEIINAILMGPSSQHTHFDPVFPLYSEITGPIRGSFTLKLYQTDGQAHFDLDRQETVTKIEWDDTGSEEAPILLGSPLPHRLMQWTGHVTIDPRRSVGGPSPIGHGFPQRGWYSPQIEVVTTFAKAGPTTQLMRLPFYSMLDPNAPDGSLSGAPILISSCYPHSPATTEWGTNYVEVDSYLPLAPISTVWSPPTGTASYGGKNIGLGFFQTRVDIDFHGGVPGRLLQHLDEQNFTTADRHPVIDPAILGPGTHPYAFIWSKPTLDLKEIVNSLLVWPVTVGEGVPPCTTCDCNPALCPTPPPASPIITSPLRAGDTVIRGSGVAGAVVHVFINGTVFADAATDGAGAFARTVDPLVAGQVVTATQTVGTLTSALSAAVTVIGVTPPPPPVLEQKLCLVEGTTIKACMPFVKP